MFDFQGFTVIFITYWRYGRDKQFARQALIINPL